MSSKRPRSASLSSSAHSSTSSPSSPSSKLAKFIPDALYTSHACTLPPTCSYPRKPTQLSSPQEVEEHYAKYHTHVCEHERCMRVFPDARFLELHFAECHDPITALKKDRGQKIFACYLATCPRVFMTPKGRRLHLIQSHGYPKQFFFAVTNKGIGGLLHKWGQGASLFRGDWRPRVHDHDMKSASESGDEHKSETGSEMDIEGHRDTRRPIDSQHLVGSRAAADNPPDNTLQYPSTPRALLSPSPSSARRPLDPSSPESDSLTNAMSSLTLVPDKIRFGRGGKKGGFPRSLPAKPTTTPPSRGVLHPETAMDAATPEKAGEKCFKGRAGRRRAQGMVASQSTSGMNETL